MSQFLMIQNIGVAPVEGFTLLGASTTRLANRSDLIGQFGSGNKYAINLLLRSGIKFYIYCGNVCLEFFSEPREIDDNISKVWVNQVKCKISGKTEDNKTINRTEDLSWTTDSGIGDWRNMYMALREFVSNSIDRSIRQGVSIKDGVEVIPVLEKSVRAKSGYTRIFIEFTPEVAKFYTELPKRFLHFTHDNGTILPKAKRNISDSQGSMIYRRGVFVRELGISSLYDYNFTNTLKIDECRNSNEYDTKYAISLMLINTDKKEEIIKKIIENPISLESNINLNDYTFTTPETKLLWKEAFRKNFGNSILSQGLDLLNLIKKKGKRSIVFPLPWYLFLEQCGVETEHNVLTEDEKTGREIVELTEEMTNACKEVWNKLEITYKPFPPCFGFVENGSKTKGFYRDNCVYLNMNVDKKCEDLYITILEEFAHYITGASDNSREFQEFFMQYIVRKWFL